MGRYHVEMKKFKDGTWYTKTDTDSLNSAISVAHCWSDGREYNVIDTETGAIVEHQDEDQSMKQFVTSKEGFDMMHPYGYTKKENNSDFELADFCRGGDLTEDEK